MGGRNLLALPFLISVKFIIRKTIRENNCFKNPNDPTSNDLITTNRPKSFRNLMVIETGLSDFDKMCTTVMKMYYIKQKPTIIHYRKCMDFNNDSLIKDFRPPNKIV